MGSEQKQALRRSEVDTSAPIESVMEAVTRFGGIGFWKPHMHNPTRNNCEEGSNSAKAEDDPVTEERDELQILKEIEAKKARFEELKVKLHTEIKVNTYPSNDELGVQVNEDELSKVDILNMVDEATEEVKQCTSADKEASSQVNMSAEFKNSDYNVPVAGPTMSIGQILSRKLVSAEKRSQKRSVRWKVSLAQILNKAEKRGDHGGGGGGEKGAPAKRMTFGFCV